MAAPVVVEKEMGLSRPEFFRTLAAALGTSAYTVEGDRVVLDGEGGRRLEITLGPEGERRIALLTVPMMQVRLEFTGYGTFEAAAAIAKFDRMFKRGGG